MDMVKKVCLLGDPGVGKTSLVRRFVTDQFDDKYLSTIGAKVTKKAMIIDVPNRQLRINLILMIWDVAGNQDYPQFYDMYLKGMEGVLTVADLSRRNTLEGLKAAVLHVDRSADGAPVVFLLNKADLVDLSSVDLNDIMALAESKDVPVLVTSAKTGMNVEKAFERISEMIVSDWARKKFGDTT
jgi:small GTP-binding protein